MPEQPMSLDFIDHQVATGRTSSGNAVVFILLREDPIHRAILLGCPHVCDRIVEQLREARGSLWPHQSGDADESDEFHTERLDAGSVATYVAGDARGDASIADVERTLARHERSARMLRLWLDAKSDGGVDPVGETR